MASKVGLVLALDGEKEFAAGLKASTEAVKLAREAMKASDAQYKGQANTIAALTAKQKNLANVSEKLAEKQKSVQAGFTNSNATLQQINTAMDKYRNKIQQIQNHLNLLKKAGLENTDAYKAWDAELKKQQELLKEEGTERKKQLANYNKWNSELVKVNKEIRANNNAIEENEKYLKEAQDSADGCAKSIDRFGKETKEAEKDLNSFGQVLEDKLFKQFTKEKMFDLAVEGLKRIGRAAVEAAKAMVSAGMEFDAQMSRVAAISGASSADMATLTDKARELGRTTVYTATEAGSAMEQLSLAGWRTASIVEGIDGVLALASASGMDLGQAAEYVSDNLNAFGREASYATQLSDIMAYAMSNSSMTTEDLGEAYEKVAASAAAYGYTETEITAVLMNMANAGRKGSEAGTSLNTIMSRLATNTSKCADTIAEYNGGVDIIYDQTTGKMRPLTNVLEDLYGVWVKLDDEQRNALAKTIAGTRQSNALYSVMAGMETVVGGTARSFSEYANELQNCEGAAKKMADVSLDNLAGDVELMNDAVDGLYISMEEKLDPALRTLVQTWTDSVNGLASLFDEPRTELSGFLTDLKDANTETQGLLDSYNEHITSTDEVAATYDAYGKKLVELNTEAQNSAAAQYELNLMVEQLSNTIPGLSAILDDETLSYEEQNAKILELTESSKNYALAQTLVAAQTEATTAAIQAEVNQSMADSAVRQATKDLEEYAEAHQGAAEASQRAYENGAVLVEENVREYRAYEQALVDAQLEQQKATELTKETEEANRGLNEALQEVANSHGLDLDFLTTSQEELQEAVRETNEVVADQEEVLEEAGDVADEVADTVEMDVKKIMSAYTEMSNSFESSISGMVSLTQAWEQADSVGVDKMLENLDSQIQGLSTWKENMVTLAGQVGNGLSQELYDKLVEMGPESANLVQDLVNSMYESGEENTSKLQELSDKWAEAMSLASDSQTKTIEQATQAGKDVASAMQEGYDITVEGWKDRISTGATTAISGATEEITEAAETSGKTAGAPGGKALAVAYAEGITNNASAAAGASNSLKGEAESPLQDNSGAEGLGVNFGQGYAQGIQSTADLVSAAATMLGQAALAATQAAQASASPSKKAAKLGTYYGQGYEVGITKTSASVSKAAAELAKKAIKSTGNALKDSGFTSSQTKAIQKKITNAFDVSWYSGSGKNKKKKDVETYYSDVLKAAKDYESRKSDLNNWSLKQEEAYWTAVLRKLKKGTKAYDEARQEIQKIKDDIISQTSKNQDTVLDYYTTYQDISLKAEMQYWDKARKQFKAGTTERIAADKKYYEAKKAYTDKISDLNDSLLKEAQDLQNDMTKSITSAESDYTKEVTKINEDLAKEITDIKEDLADKLKDIEEDLTKELTDIEEDRAEKILDIQEDLAKDIDDLNKNYTDSLKNRTEELAKSMNLFDAFESEGNSSEKLIENLQSQVEALEMWEGKLAELKARGISQTLYDELSQAGPDELVNIYSLAEMTDEQLAEYQRLYDAKRELAAKQSLIDNEILKAETEANIKAAQEEAKAAEKAANDEAKAASNAAKKQAADDKATAKAEANTAIAEAKQAAKDAITLARQEADALIAEAYQTVQDGIISLTQTYMTEYLSVTQDAPNALMDALNSAAANSEDTIAKMFKNMEKEATNNSSLASMNEKIITQVGQMVPDFEKIGKNALSGLLLGMTNKDLIKVNSEEMVNQILKNVQDAAEIHSPSKLFDREVGQYLGLGVADGFDESIGATSEAAMKMIRESVAAAKREFDLQEARLQSDVAGIKVGGAAMVNDLTATYAPQTIVNVDNSDLNANMMQINATVSAIMTLMNSVQVVLDSGELVGAISGQMDTALARDYSSSNRGILRR